MKFNPALLVAGGLGALGLGYLVYKGTQGGDEPTDAEADAGAAAAGDAAGLGAGTTPTGTTTTSTTMPAGAMDPTGMAGSGAVGATMPDGTGATTGSTAGTPQGRQMGPYTVFDDGSGMQLVVETATKTPVGVIDQQGNLIPITVDANGNVQIASGAGAGGTATSAGMATTGATSLGDPRMQSSASTADAAAGTSTLGTRSSGSGSAVSSQYSGIVADLLANASNPGVGSAASSPMGATTGSSTAMGTTTTGNATSTSGAERYGVVDDGAGHQVVVDMATRTPVGILDQQGNVIPLDALGGASSAAGTGNTGSTMAASTSGSATRATGSASSAAERYGVVDDGAGHQVVVDMATRTPVGILDQQGNVIPLDALGGASSAAGTGNTGSTMAASTGTAASAGYGTAGRTGASGSW